MGGAVAVHGRPARGQRRRDRRAEVELGAGVHEGEEPALNRKPRPEPPVPAKIDGRAEAYLVATCCSPAPAGRARWTLTLLAGELKRRGLVTSVSIETVRRALKKTSCGRGGSSPGASRSGRAPGS